MASNPNNPSGQQYPPPHEGSSGPAPPQYQTSQHPQEPLPASSEGQWAEQAGPSPGHYGAPQQYFPLPSQENPPETQQPNHPAPENFAPPSQSHPQTQDAQYVPYKPAPEDFAPPPQSHPQAQAASYAPYKPVPENSTPPPQPNPYNPATEDFAPPPQSNTQAHMTEPTPYKPAPGDFPPPPQSNPHQVDSQLPPPPEAQTTPSAPYYPSPPSDPSQGISHTGVTMAPPPQWKLPDHSQQGAPSAQPDVNYPPPPAGPPPTQSADYYPPPPPGAPPSTASGAYPPEKQGDHYTTQSGGEYYPPLPPLASLQPGQDSAGGYQPPLPPRRKSANFGEDDPNNPIHYTRDPHKLVGYLVPFPKPIVKGVETSGIPDRFLIYTPPPPPLTAPKEGEKEDKLHKIQRKWQEEVRAAKTSDAKTASWKGVKGKATKGISYVMSKTTSSSLDFVNRIPGTQKASSSDPSSDLHSEDGIHEDEHTHKTVGLEEMILVYPSSYKVPPEQVKIEFVNTMMRTKTKAQKDAVIATGLLPVSAAIDIMATLIWPFGGLLEVDSVWAYSSIRGAKTARSVTKRLTSSSGSGTANAAEDSGPQLHLIFKQSPRLEVLDKYLAAKCQERDRYMFPRMGAPPTETEVLNAIGWAPSQSGGDHGKNWEDEQWETQEVKDDMRLTLGKAAKEWQKWCEAFAKNPEQALKK